jgi:putative phosphoesterase
MKLALLGDIHGNAHALEAVLSAAKRVGADKLLITGDLVGYYYEPAKVLELLEPWNKVMVRGNHESMIAEAQISKTYLIEIERRYGKGLRYALESLSYIQLEKLKSLPTLAEISVDDLRLLLCHGSPLNNEDYIYPDAQDHIFDKISVDGFDYVIMGHTHYPMQINGSKSIYINPGSVGQPRNRVLGAHWALLNTEARSCQFHVEQYNISEVVAMCRRIDPQLTYLANVLKRSK